MNSFYRSVYMTLPLSEFTIHRQILIGYIPVLAILFFLAFSSFHHYKKFDDSLQQLRENKKENLIFIENEKDILELQRNVLVFSYVGYQGVLKKIDFLQNSLNKKFALVQPIVQKDKEINDRLNRMINHYDHYKSGFKEAVKHKQRLKDLSDNYLQPLFSRLQKTLDEVDVSLVQQNQYESAYAISNINHNLTQINNNIDVITHFPDTTLILKVRTLLSEIDQQTSDLERTINDVQLFGQMSNFQNVLEEYRTVFKKIIRTSRSYMHLVNVVLAGKAAEIIQLSNELYRLVAERSEILETRISTDLQHSHNQFLFWSLLAGFLGIASSVIIARGIAKPVSAMATTFSQLAMGKAKDIVIPGQDRKDEIGLMAKAADKFKAMAIKLENQTIELEEFAYRTSHDLRSPLVSSIGLLDFAQKAIDDKNYDQASKSMGLVKNALTKLETLVRDLLELTKANHIDEDKQEINFKNIINESLEKLSHMENYDRLDIQTSLKFKDAFISQKSRIVLILENLISNAIKYQDTGKNSSFIKISTYTQRDNIILEIEDNGLGVPENLQNQMFSMFKRFHPRVSFGSGLGLYMMKKSADILGGTIKFIGTNQGSIFRLIIPKT